MDPKFWDLAPTSYFYSYTTNAIDVDYKYSTSTVQYQLIIAVGHDENRLVGFRLQLWRDELYVSLDYANALDC